jgi:hypothetical protein
MKDAKGTAENRSAAFSLFAHSLDNYIDEVIAGQQGTNAPNVPKLVKDSVHNSLQANIEYHDFMSGAHQESGDTAYLTYHKVKADSYRALKAN